MKAAADAELAALVASVAFRLPAMPHTELLAVLADVAKCDGAVDPGEVRVVREVALAIGADPDAWPAIAAELGLAGQGAGRAPAAGPGAPDPHAVLGVGRGASPAEIQAAYRKLVSDYHPDRVANLPREFQQVAHDKMTEINAAYAALRREREAPR
jgi:DnaJ like chaperone protein